MRQLSASSSQQVRVTANNAVIFIVIIDVNEEIIGWHESLFDVVNEREWTCRLGQLWYYGANSVCIHYL